MSNLNASKSKNGTLSDGNLVTIDFESPFSYERLTISAIGTANGDAIYVSVDSNEAFDDTPSTFLMPAPPGGFALTLDVSVNRYVYLKRSTSNAIKYSVMVSNTRK